MTRFLSLDPPFRSGSTTVTNKRAKSLMSGISDLTSPHWAQPLVRHPVLLNRALHCNIQLTHGLMAHGSAAGQYFRSSTIALVC